MGLAGRDQVVIRVILLEHQPHGMDIVGRVTPVTPCFQVAQAQFVLHPQLDTRHRVGDLTRDEFQATARTLMVEQDAGAGEEIVAFAIIHRDPVAVDLGHAVGCADRTAWSRAVALPAPCRTSRNWTPGRNGSSGPRCEQHPECG